MTTLFHKLHLSWIIIVVLTQIINSFVCPNGPHKNQTYMNEKYEQFDPHSTRHSKDTNARTCRHLENRICEVLVFWNIATIKKNELGIRVNHWNAKVICWKALTSLWWSLGYCVFAAPLVDVTTKFHVWTTLKGRKLHIPGRSGRQYGRQKEEGNCSYPPPIVYSELLYNANISAYFTKDRWNLSAPDLTDAMT